MNANRRQFLCAAAVAAAVPMAASHAKSLTKDTRWDEETDVLVIGYGGAGACAAISAFDAGAKVLVVEKMSAGGGNTAVSSGGLMVPQEKTAARKYLRATYDLGNSECDEELLDTFCDEILNVPEWLKSLKPETKVSVYGHAGYQNLEGWEVIDKWRVVSKGKRSGDLLFEVYQYAVEEARKIPVWFNAPAKQLIMRDGEVVGAVVSRNGKDMNIKARKGVVLATGGFEYDKQSLQTFALGENIHALGNPGNTGDGLRMAQTAGAKLWHMTCYSWQLGTELPGCKANQQVSTVAPSFIWVDRFGKRFADEFSADGHTRGYLVTRYDPVAHGYPQIPCYQIMDEKAVKRGPVTVTTSGYGINREGYKWSRDNSQELGNGVIVRGETLAELAKKINVPADALEETVRKWNEDMKKGRDTLFNRPVQNPQKKVVHADQGRVPVVSEALSDKGPYFAVKLWPSLLNTQGGPKKNVHGNIIKADGTPVARLYVAGELGSMWGSIYQGACNNAESIVFGRISGRNAAKEKNWA